MKIKLNNNYLQSSLASILICLGLSQPLQAAETSTRIISAGSSVTELIYALGAEQQLIAVDVTSQLPEASELPKVGYHRQLSSEGLLSLSPTQLIGSEEMGPESTLKALKQAGVAVNVINTKPTLEGLLIRIVQLAELTNTQQNSEALKQKVTQQINDLEKFKSKPKKKVIFLMISPGRPATVAGSNTPADKVIELSGAINPAAKQIQNYKPLSMEALITMQPDAIMISQRSWNNYKSVDAVLEALPMLAATPAGKNKNIISIDGTALLGGIGLKSLSEARRLQHVLYPEAEQK